MLPGHLVHPVELLIAFRSCWSPPSQRLCIVLTRITESSVPQDVFMCMWATVFMVLPYITKGATSEHHWWPKTEVELSGDEYGRYTLILVLIYCIALREAGKSWGLRSAQASAMAWQHGNQSSLLMLLLNYTFVVRILSIFRFQMLRSINYTRDYWHLVDRNFSSNGILAWISSFNW